MNLKLLAIILAIAILLASGARAQKLEEILESSRAAIQDLRGISYTFEFRGVGSLAASSPIITGEALMVRTAGLIGSPIALRIAAQLPVAFGDVPGKNIEQDFAADGSKFVINNHSYKMRIQGDPSEAMYAKLSIDRLLLGPLLATDPYAALEDAQLTLAEERSIRGIQCYCVQATKADTVQRWYVSKVDFLPRAKETNISSTGSQILEIHDLQLLSKIPHERFVLAELENYRSQDAASLFQEIEQVEDRLTGDIAPGFELADAAGKMIALSDFKGDVVVLDFWATWCGPCRLAMPTLQSLHEQHGGNGLQVIGINIWETGDPQQFMVDQQLDYGLLLGDDSTAKDYAVDSIPRIILIDRQGRIAAIYRGFSTEIELELRNHVEELLADQ